MKKNNNNLTTSYGISSVPVDLSFDIQDALIMLHDFKHQRVSIHNQQKCGIISSADATNELMSISKKEYALKEKLVTQVHVTGNGDPRKIEYKESRGMWKTIMPGKTYMFGKTKEALIDKLFEFYGLTLADTKIKSIFLLAVKEREATANRNPGTISRYYKDFDRYITKDFQARDIRSITKADIKAYKQELFHSTTLKKSNFLAYKGVLNLIFEYALEYDIIDKNPVTAVKNTDYYKDCDLTVAKPEQKILSQEEIELLKAEVRKRMRYDKKYNGYFINGYAILISIETGMRVAELCALKWDDINFDKDFINIHSQQLYIVKKGGKEYYYVGYTKNERGIPNGGRDFPLTTAIRVILGELKHLQEQQGIVSEFVFCHEDGEWIKTDAYETCLRRMCQSLGFTVTNNHALRMALNSNVFIPLGIPVTERARMLGHSVETNLRKYSFAGKNSNGNILEVLNGYHPGTTQIAVS